MADDDSDDDDVIETLRAFLRVFRVVRILKIARLNPDTTVLYRAIRLSTRALAVPFTFLLIGAFFFGAPLCAWRRGAPHANPSTTRPPRLAAVRRNHLLP